MRDAPRVVHVTPARAPLAIFSAKREPELQRIFGQDVEIVHMSYLDFDPPALARAIQEVRPDAVVLASAPRAHREAIQQLAGETLILRPIYKRIRTHRGEVEERQIGFGLLRDQGAIEPVADRAFAERSALQQALRRRMERGGRAQ